MSEELLQEGSKGRYGQGKKSGGSKKGAMRIVAIILVAVLVLGALLGTFFLTSGFGLLKETVLTINGHDFDKDDYYLQLYMSKKSLLGSADILSNTQLNQKVGDNTLEALLRDTVESALKVTAAVKTIAADNKLTLSAADKNTIKTQKEAFINDIGGKSQLSTFLRNQRTSEKALDRYYEANMLLEKVDKELYASGKPLDLTDAEKQTAQSKYQENYAKFSYILFLTVNKDNSQMSEVKKAQIKELANQAFAKLATDDFNKLIDDYSDDAETQKKQEYASFALKGNSGSDPYDNAIFGTDVGKTSALTELKNGFIIVKRLALDDTKLEDYYKATRTAKMQWDIGQKQKGYNAEWGKAYNQLVIR